jgi:RNA-directed DNA polymerase
MRPWLHHRYKAIGFQFGVEEATVISAAHEVEMFLAKSPNSAPILTLGHLAACARVPYKFLRTVVSRRARTPYLQFAIVGKNGRRRRISTPSRDLMTVQRWIANNVLAETTASPNAFAYRKGLSIVDCAQRHCSSRWLVKLDVVRFFHSISELQVFGLFRDMGYRPLVAFELSRLCTWPITGATFERAALRSAGPDYAFDAIGSLPIGAPTSPALSNLFMRVFDTEISQYCAERDLVYSRYADDIFISSDQVQFSRSLAVNVVQTVRAKLTAIGLHSNDAKATIVPPGARKVVLGMLVNDREPRLSPEFKKRLRMHYYYIQRFGAERHAKERAFPSVPALQRHLRGLIAFAYQVEPGYAKTVRDSHNSVRWL